MDPAAVLSVLVKADGVEQTNSKLSTVSGNLEKAGKSGESMGKSVKKGVKATAAAAGAAAVVGVKEYGKLDRSMTESLAIMGEISGPMRAKMEKAARAVGKSTKFGASDAADAYFFLASAGLSAQQSLDALPETAKFAQAGNFDLATATDLSTDALSAMGLKSEDAAKNLSNLIKVQDVFVKANTLANATVEQFSTSITNKGGAALKAVNKDLEEGVAVLAAYADQGTKGQRAGNALNIILRDLQRAALSNAEEFRKYNVEVFDSRGEMSHLADIIGDLEGAFEGMTTKQRRAMITQMGFNDRSLQFMLQLMGTSESIRSYDTDLRDAARTTDEVANNQLKGFTGAWIRVKSQIDDVVLSIGEWFAPALQNLGEVLGDDTLDASRKFEQAMEIVVNTGTDMMVELAHKAGKAAPKIAMSLASGFVRAWSQFNPFAKIFSVAVIGKALAPTMFKLFTVVSLLRLAGGKGKLAAAGASLGHIFGSGFAGGAAPVIGASTLASTGAPAAGALLGGAASKGIGASGANASRMAGGGSQAFTKAASGLALPAATAGSLGAAGAMGSSMGKKAGGAMGMQILKYVGGLAKTGGLIGAGILLADGLVTGIGKGMREGSDDLNEALEAMSSSIVIPGIGNDIWASDALEAMETISEGQAKVTDKMLADVERAKNGLEGKLSGTAQEELDKVHRLMEMGARFDLEINIQTTDPSMIRAWRGDLAKLRGGFLQTDKSILAVSKRMQANIRSMGQPMGKTREMISQSLRATARAFFLQMKRSGNFTEAGWERIQNIIRRADLVNPTRSKVNEFAREWAKGFVQAEGITRRGVKRMMNDLEAMPAPMRQLAWRIFAPIMREAAESNQISGDEIRGLREKIFTQFDMIVPKVDRKSGQMRDRATENTGNMARNINEYTRWSIRNISQANRTFGGDPLNFKAIPEPRAKKQTGGIVPGTGTGDKVNTAIPPGSFVLNQKATQKMMAGFQKGGLAPVALEPGERVFFPNEVSKIGLGNLQGMNRDVPRFQRGGLFPELQGPADALATRLAGMGFTPTSTFRPESTTHHGVGEAIDYGDSINSMSGVWSVLRPQVAQLAELFGPSYLPGPTLWKGGASFSSPTLQSTHEDHVHVAVTSAISKLAKGFASLAKPLFKGPDGPLKDLGQNAVDHIQQQANVYLRQLIASSAVAEPQSMTMPAGPGRIVGASTFGGVGDPLTGSVGYQGDNLSGTQAYAELGDGSNMSTVGTALGGLPYKHPLRVSANNKSIIARKLDVGLGGADVQGHATDLDLWHEAAGDLGLPGVWKGLVKIQGAQRGGEIQDKSFIGPQGPFEQQRVKERWDRKYEKNAKKFASRAMSRAISMTHLSRKPRIGFTDRSSAIANKHKGTTVFPRDTLQSFAHNKNNDTAHWLKGAMIHELAHINQRSRVYNKSQLAEGGAEGFERLAAPKIYGSFGEPYRQVDTGKYNWYAKMISQKRSKAWIMNHQFLQGGGKIKKQAAMMARRLWKNTAPHFGEDPGSKVPKTKLFAPPRMGADRGYLDWHEDGSGSKAAALPRKLSVGLTQKDPHSLMTLLHEWAHSMTMKNLKPSRVYGWPDWKREGGAEGWTQKFGPQILKQTGLKPDSLKQYMKDQKGTPYSKAANKAQATLGDDWVKYKQFGLLPPQARKLRANKMLRRRLHRVRGIDLPSELVGKIHQSDKDAAKYSEWANNAMQLRQMDDEGNETVGKFRDHPEGYWWKKNLSTLLNLRNQMISGHDVASSKQSKLAKELKKIEPRRDKMQDQAKAVAKKIKQARAQMERVTKNPPKAIKSWNSLAKAERIKRARRSGAKWNKDHKQWVGDWPGKGKGWELQKDATLEFSRERLKRMRESIQGAAGKQEGRHNRIKRLNRYIGAVSNKRDDMKTAIDAILQGGDLNGHAIAGLEQVHGKGGPMSHIKGTPTIGTLGGAIQSAQINLRDLGEKNEADPPSPGSVMNIEQLREFAKAVQLGAFRREEPFAGFFAKGGFIPSGKFGIAGETGSPEIVSGPARVTSVDDTARILERGGERKVRVELNFADGMGWLADFVELKVDGKIQEHERDDRGAANAGVLVR